MLLFHIPEVMPATEYSLYWDNLTSGWQSWSDYLLPSYCTLHITDTRVTHAVHGTIEYQIQVPFHYTNGNSEAQRWSVIWIGTQIHCLSPSSWHLPSYWLMTVGVSFDTFYTCGPSACASSCWSQWVKGSELEEAWVKGFNNNWIFHPHRTQCLVFYALAWFWNEIMSVSPPSSYLCQVLLFPLSWAPCSP